MKTVKTFLLSCCVIASALAADSRPPMVSLVRLLADPQSFDGQRVAVAGFLSLDYEGSALYLHADDYEHGIRKNALWVFIPKERAKKCLDKQYVSVIGTINAESTGHMGAYSGSIESEDIFDAGPPDPECVRPEARQK